MRHSDATQKSVRDLCHQRRGHVHFDHLRNSVLLVKEVEKLFLSPIDVCNEPCQSCFGASSLGASRELKDMTTDKARGAVGILYPIMAVSMKKQYLVLCRYLFIILDKRDSYLMEQSIF